MHHPTPLIRAVAAALCATSLGVLAQETKSEKESSSVPAMSQGQGQYDIATAAAKKALDSLGLQLWGYMRAGAYYAKDGLPKGHYGLGDLGYNRLGNEGDQYVEFGIGKKWELSGTKAGVYWMPYLYNAQCCNQNGTKQIYADLSGLGMNPELTLWGGQRYHRIQDVHIIDQWLMEDGDNFGAGVDSIKFGGMGGSLNVAFYIEGTTDNSKQTSNGKRMNLQLRDLPVGPGGMLNLTAGIIRGDFSDKRTSFALGALYNQKFGTLTNSVFVQGSNGHSDLRGKFYALNGTTTTTTSSPFICTVTPNADGSCPTAGLATNPNPTTVTSTTHVSGAQQFRLVDAINWQTGLWGGQALVGYQTGKPDDTGLKTTNLALGGRVSYGVAKNIKLIGDANIASLKTDGTSRQRLDKETVAIAFAPNIEFWSRPEMRFYLSRVGGNDAVKAAGTFGRRSSAFLAGLQVEAWWE